MDGFCRGCLVKYDDPDELLEYTEKNRRLFIYSTGLQVKRNDSFTFQLCKSCYLNMKQSCKFKKLCRTSDKKFKTYLSLKEAGDTVDLCNYLKNNDENFTLRFPHWGGNSTPANQRKDDDNESTCTSIGNFMRDILQGTEMPDSEARIIRQVIMEEADILDDSLDSHWLQDDVSIDTNFQLDFSFSPFSTPRSVSNDHCYTPRRLTEQENHYGLPKVMSNKPTAQNKVDDKEDDERPKEIKEYDIFSDSLLDKIVDQNYETSVKIENLYDENEIQKIQNDLIVEEVDALSDNQVNQVNSKNYYVDNTLIEQTVNDVVRILEGKNVEENDTGITSIFNDKSVRETQKAVASLFDAKGSKHQTDSVEIFHGKSGKKHIDVDSSVLNSKGVGETQRAVASIFDGKSGKNQTEMSSIFDGKGDRTQTEVTGDGNRGKNQTEITSIFGKPVVVKTVDGKGGKNETFIRITDGRGGKNEAVSSSLLDGKGIGNRNDDCGIERRLDEALKDENQEITLEDLLGSPAAYPNTAASTPTIHNILFGEKLDGENSNKIDSFDNVQGDENMSNLFDNVEVKDEPASPPLTPQPEGVPTTMTINVADNLSVNLSYTLPENAKTPKDTKKPKKAKTKPPEPDNEEIEVVDCVCMICDKKFKNMRILKLHSAMKHKIKLPRAKKKREEVKLRICDYCGKEGMDKRNFIRHVKTHNKGPKESIRCERCGVKFMTKAKYNKHRKTHLGHNPIQQVGDRACCDICGKEVNRKNIYKHRRIHQRQYRGHCEICNKGYYMPSDYKAHMLEHTGERPHACEACGDRFLRKNALVRHMRAHTGEKRFVCDNCNKKYANKVNLVKHIASGRCRDFKETGKMNKIRHKTLRAKNTIQVLKLMTEEDLAMKPFVCVYCQTRHKTENILIRHQRMSKMCKEIQYKKIAPTIIEILYEKAPSAQREQEDLSHLKTATTEISGDCIEMEGPS